MEKAEKEFAAAIYRITIEIEESGFKYYSGKISELEFKKVLMDKVFLITESFLIKEG